MSVLNSPQSIEREARMRALLDEFNIPQTHLNAVKLYNSHQPYHNWHHCVVVALNALEAAREMNVSLEKQRLLLLAGLYHDYDHTGQPDKADVINIARAVSGAHFWLGVKEQGMSRADKNEIVNLIAATEATHQHHPRTMLEAIIIDADVLATMGEDREDWWDALSQELGQQVDLEGSMTFLRCQNLHSLWGIRRSDAIIAELSGHPKGR